MLKRLFQFTVLILSLGQLTSIQKQGGLNIYLFDLAVGVFVLISFIYFIGEKKSFKIPKDSVFFALFFFAALSSFIFNLGKYSDIAVFQAGFYLTRFFIYLLAGINVFNMLDKNILSPQSLFKTIIFSGVLVSVLGLFQLKLLPDFEVLDSSLGWDPHKNRLASTFFDPNFTGAYLVICLTLLIDKYYQNNKKLDLSEYVFFLIIFAAFILTFSRSAWGMFGLVILIYGIFKSRILLLLSLVVVFSAYFSVPRIQTRISGITDPADSAAYRLVSWKNSLKIIKENYLTGAGYNFYRFVQKDYGFLESGNFSKHSGAGSDSSLLFVLATTGIIGFLFYFIGLVIPLFRKDVFIIALTVSLLGESFFINSLFYPQIMFAFFCLLFTRCFLCK